MVRQVTMIRLEVVINGRTRRVVATKQEKIRALLGEDLPLGRFLREMVEDVLDAGSSIDDGSSPNEAPTYEDLPGGADLSDGD